MKVTKKLEEILTRTNNEKIIEFLEEDVKIPIAMFDDLSFMTEINGKTEYHAHLDSSTDYIIIEKY